MAPDPTSTFLFKRSLFALLDQNSTTILKAIESQYLKKWFSFSMKIKYFWWKYFPTNIISMHLFFPKKYIKVEKIQHILTIWSYWPQPRAWTLTRDNKFYNLGRGFYGHHSFSQIWELKKILKNKTIFPYWSHLWTWTPRPGSMNFTNHNG